MAARHGPWRSAASLRAPANRVHHPEFRDLEFIHVRAKSSINVYGGRSDACTCCFARPTHEYLNLDAGRDFERVIVAKVNAAELREAGIRSGVLVAPIIPGISDHREQLRLDV